MADAGNNFQPSKKRAAGVQLSEDDPDLLDDNDEAPEQVLGTFKRASEEVLATRRIVKVRRQQTSSVEAPTRASNPFSAIRLVPTTPVEAQTFGIAHEETEPIGKKGSISETEVYEENDENAKQSENKGDESKAEQNAEEVKTDEASEQKIIESVVDVVDKGNDIEEDNAEKFIEKNSEIASISSFQQLSSSQNAFSGLSGIGFSGASFSFGSVPKDGPGSSTGSLFGLSNNGKSSIFGTSGANVVSKSEGSKFPSLQEVPLETGEENEKAVFTSDSVLFEYIDGLWKERGKGEIKVNISTEGTSKARLVMRARGNYRLLINASLFPDMKLTGMDKKGITFACVNTAAEGKGGLSTYALKFKDASVVEDFRTAVMEYKGNTSGAPKTPENSP